MVSKRWWTIGNDYIDLLYLPYTFFHMGFLVIGAMLAPTIHWGVFMLLVIAFFIGTGISAHCFDELQGRPLGTVIPGKLLLAGGIAGLTFTLLIALLLTIYYFPPTIIIYLFLAFILIVYNGELFKGLFHRDMVFIFGYATCPLIAGYWIVSRQFPTFDILIYFVGLSGIAGVETVINHFIKFNSANYQEGYDQGKGLDYLQRAIYSVLWVIYLIATGLLAGRVIDLLNS